MQQQRIGLLGGTFNPIHNGHLHIASEVSKHLHLDQVLFIPAGRPPHKSPEGILPAKDRVNMLEIALSEYPMFDISDLEIKREGPSYTIDTVSTLKKTYQGDHLFFIVGMDAFSQIERWKAPETFLSLCDFAIISRPGFPFSALPSFGPLSFANRPSLSKLDDGKSQAYTLKLSATNSAHFINIPHSEISSSEIRRRISTDLETKNLLPHPVESYIIERKCIKDCLDLT